MFNIVLMEWWPCGFYSAPCPALPCRTMRHPQRTPSVSTCLPPLGAQGGAVVAGQPVGLPAQAGGAERTG